MSRRAAVIAGGVLMVIGALALALTFGLGRGSVRDHIAGKYTKVEVTDPAFAGSTVYSSPRAASLVVQDITERWKPADRRNDPSGYFLRYRNDIVVVSSQPEGGSRIYVDDERSGYNRWYPYIGGYWGTYSGPGDVFRGGGPGAGK